MYFPNGRSNDQGRSAKNLRNSAKDTPTNEECMINFQTSPEQYHHWKLQVDGAVATLSMDVQEDETLADGYKLKLNSYDLGVDIELADAIRSEERRVGKECRSRW